MRGAPGTGKSSVAAWIARQRNWRYYEHTVTARTEVTDLMWTFDAVRKLAHASTLERKDLNDHDYVEPGPLWWAFDRDQARRRGSEQECEEATEPYPELNSGRDFEGAVVLVDEIDKADPDVPNALLVPLGSGRFQVAETRTEVELQDGVRALVVITTNDERDLPPAFERRCIVHDLGHPDPKQLVTIAAAHAADRQQPLTDDTKALVLRIAEKVKQLQDKAERARLRGPGIAEFLDAVWACLGEGIDPKSDERWAFVESMTLAKDRRLR
jgi:MoxR-like ATPase